LTTVRSNWLTLPNQGSTTTVMRRVAGEPHGSPVTTSIAAWPGRRAWEQDRIGRSHRCEYPAVGPYDALDKDPKELDSYSVPHATAGGGDPEHVADDNCRLPTVMNFRAL